MPTILTGIYYNRTYAAVPVKINPVLSVAWSCGLTFTVGQETDDT